MGSGTGLRPNPGIGDDDDALLVIVEVKGIEVFVN